MYTMMGLDAILIKWWLKVAGEVAAKLQINSEATEESKRGSLPIKLNEVTKFSLWHQNI